MENLQEYIWVSVKPCTKSDSGTSGYMQGMTMTAGANNATPAQQAVAMQLGARGPMH
jgi:hypothetical protein